MSRQSSSQSIRLGNYPVNQFDWVITQSNSRVVVPYPDTLSEWELIKNFVKKHLKIEKEHLDKAVISYGQDLVDLNLAYNQQMVELQNEIHKHFKFNIT